LESAAVATSNSSQTSVVLDARSATTFRLLPAKDANQLGNHLHWVLHLLMRVAEWHFSQQELALLDLIECDGPAVRERRAQSRFWWYRGEGRPTPGFHPSSVAAIHQANRQKTACIICHSLVDLQHARRQARAAGRSQFSPGDGCANRHCSLHHCPARFARRQLDSAQKLLAGECVLVLWPSSVASRARLFVAPATITTAITSPILSLSDFAPSSSSTRLAPAASTSARCHATAVAAATATDDALTFRHPPAPALEHAHTPDTSTVRPHHRRRRGVEAPSVSTGSRCVGVGPTG